MCIRDRCLWHYPFYFSSGSSSGVYSTKSDNLTLSGLQIWISVSNLTVLISWLRHNLLNAFRLRPVVSIKTVMLSILFSAIRMRRLFLRVIVNLLYLLYIITVSYTHLRAHETRHDLVCRLLLEKKKKK